MGLDALRAHPLTDVLRGKFPRIHRLRPKPENIFRFTGRGEEYNA
jgi:hypothetical protein